MISAWRQPFVMIPSFLTPITISFFITLWHPSRIPQTGRQRHQAGSTESLKCTYKGTMCVGGIVARLSQQFACKRPDTFTHDVAAIKSLALHAAKLLTPSIYRRKSRRWHDQGRSRGWGSKPQLRGRYKWAVSQINVSSWGVFGVADEGFTAFEVILSKGVDQFCG